MASVDDVLVAEEATLREVLERLTKSGKQCAVIVDESRRLRGIATDGDLRKAILRGVSLEAPVTQAMNRSPLVGPPDMSPAAAMALMRARGIRHLPLADVDRRVTGVLLLDELLDVPAVSNVAIVMAGGEGRRLKPLTETTPKPLLRVGGKPLLEIMLERLRAAGFRRVVMTLHYKRDMIEDYFADGTRFGLQITYRYEETPLGTAGALRELADEVDRPFLVVNSDILTKCDFRAMLAFHARHRADITVGTVPYSVDLPYGILQVDGERLAAVTEKPRLDFTINSGIYVISPPALAAMPCGVRIDMPELIAAQMQSGGSVVAFPIREYWLDVGRHGDFDKANRDVAEGLLD
jgi:dTDP-glucose pyrophosphorylase